MKIPVFLLLLCLLPVASFAQYQVITSEEGQQAILGENKRLTVFRDEPVEIDNPICVFLDSSKLESKGIDKVEWYHLKAISQKDVTVEMYKYDLQLPSYVSINEKTTSLTIPVKGTHKRAGKLFIHGVKVNLTVIAPGRITAEILE